MKILFWMFIGFDQHSTSEHLLSAVLEQLCKKGHKVHLIQKNTGGDLPPIPCNLKKYRITTTQIPYKSVDKNNFVARYLNEIRYVNNCCKAMHKNYDAVFIQSTTVAGFAVKAVRKKNPKAAITLNVQDIFPYNAVYSGSLKKDSIKFKVLAAIQRYAYNKSKHIITISEDMRDLLIEDGTPAKKINVVYNWSYQDDPYENLDLSSVSYMFDKDYFNVVYAGNIGVMQNVDLIIEAAKIMKKDKSVWFHIIGDGVYKEKLIAKASKYGIGNITFWPMQPPELAPAIYKSADINIIPLVKNVYRTALPSKTATCLACGKPIIFAIGTNSKFGKKISKETDCFVVESNNVYEFADAVKNIMDMNSISKKSHYYFEHFQKTENSCKYAKIIVDKR